MLSVQEDSDHLQVLQLVQEELNGSVVTAWANSALSFSIWLMPQHARHFKEVHTFRKNARLTMFGHNCPTVILGRVVSHPIVSGSMFMPNL
jgi:hypothetical protein